MEKAKQAVLVPLERYEELLWKEHVHDLKKEELERANYVSEFDSIMFGVPQDKRNGCPCDSCGKVAAGA